MRKFFLVLTVFCVSLYGVFADTKGEEIAKKHYDLKKSSDSYAIATMVLFDKQGNKKTRKLEMYTKETTAGKNSFIKFLEPADVAGTKFLTLANTSGGDDEQRLYLPALKKTRKISSENKNGEFVNSDFYYYDMEDRVYADNTYKFLSENEEINDKAFSGMKFFKIEMAPLDKNSPYSRVVAYINSTTYVASKMECYDKKDNALLKTILFVKYENQKEVLIPTQVMITNHKKGTKTLMMMNDVKINQGISNDVFTVKNLEQ